MQSEDDCEQWKLQKQNDKNTSYLDFTEKCISLVFHTVFEAEYMVLKIKLRNHNSIFVIPAVPCQNVI